MKLNDVTREDNFKLVVTIAGKDQGSNVVCACKHGGAEGGTIILGKGNCGKTFFNSFFLGSSVQDREIVLSLVKSDQVENVLEAIAEEIRLDEPSKGVAFVLHVKSLIGVVHSLEYFDRCKLIGGCNMTENDIKFDLVITIVNRGFAEEVIEASKMVGAEGGTILSGRGTGIHENLKILGISIEPEKEIVLTLISKDRTKDVLYAISNAVNLDKPGNGIAFVLDVEKTVGIQHLVNHCSNNQ